MDSMRLSRVLLSGGSIGAVAVWAHLTFDGLLGAAALFVAGFDALVVLGIVVAGLTEGTGRRAWARIGWSMRSIRHRHSSKATCSSCARLIVDMGPVRVCTACDRIPVASSH